jgi:hypothetical protein
MIERETTVPWSTSELMHLGDTMMLLQVRFAKLRSGEAQLRSCRLAQELTRVQIELREIAAEPTQPCPECGGEQEIVDVDTRTGEFPGGSIYFMLLACGHYAHHLTEF